VTKRTQIRFLRRVFGEARISQHRQGDAADQALRLADQAAIGLQVACLRPNDQMRCRRHVTLIDTLEG